MECAAKDRETLRAIRQLIVNRDRKAMVTLEGDEVVVKAQIRNMGEISHALDGCSSLIGNRDVMAAALGQSGITMRIDSESHGIELITSHNPDDVCTFRYKLANLNLEKVAKATALSVA